MWLREDGLSSGSKAVACFRAKSAHVAEVFSCVLAVDVDMSLV